MNNSVEQTIEFQILTWWHPGTGRGDGAVADAVAHRGEDELPLVPGRTVKGLVRDACACAAQAGILSADEIVALFGSGPPRDTSADTRVPQLEEARFHTKAGSLRFSSARLGQTRDKQTEWSSWARTNKRSVRELTAYVASTEIEKDTGIAKDKTLRTIEVVVPLTLFAFVRGPESGPWEKIDQSLRLFLRKLGSHRNRGLGRVHARLVKS
jgi:CRISPR/Cas system CSM-associated protein Csm3 (group 7 of RAMP superfamily)